MKILVLGSGAREHAIILALVAEGAGHEIFAAPGNAGIAADATLVADLDQNDPAAVTAFANEQHIDLVVIGPEAPLVAGVADALRERGIPVFGPGKAAAQMEGSKAFAKRIMDAAGVPTGRAARAQTRDEVAAAIDEFGAPFVVKADGLAAGKGVVVTSDRDAALAHADAYLPTGPNSSRAAATSSRVCARTERPVGTPAASMIRFAKAFEPSSCAAALPGPKTGMPRSRSASATPATSGASGPMTTRSMCARLA